MKLWKWPWCKIVFFKTDNSDTLFHLKQLNNLDLFFHPHIFSFHLSLTAVFFTVCICEIVCRPSLLWVSPCQHSITKVLPLTPSSHTWHGLEGDEGHRAVSAHILTFVIHSSLSTHSHHPYCVTSALLTHTCTNTAEPSELESKVPIAFLIRVASGRLSKRSLCELQSPCMSWTSKLCLVWAVGLEHLVNSPGVWFSEYYECIHCQLCMCFVCFVYPLHIHEGIVWHFWFFN